MINFNVSTHIHSTHTREHNQPLHCLPLRVLHHRSTITFHTSYWIAWRDRLASPSQSVRFLSFHLSLSIFLLYFMNTQITTDTPERWSFVLVHCKLLITRISFHEYLSLPPNPSPSLVMYGPIKGSGTKISVCDMWKQKNPKVVQFLFKFFFFVSPFYYYDSYYRLSVLDAEKTKKNFVWFFVEVRTKANSHFQDTNF